MNYLISFKNDETGAVTVDWVVLTAAIVGIGLAVVALISGGVETASEGIDDGLQTASAFTFSFGGAAIAGAMGDYFEEFDGDDILIYMAINEDAPIGFTYTGFIDTATDAPIYTDTPFDQNTPAPETLLSINGETILASDYDPGDENVSYFNPLDPNVFDPGDTI